MRLSSFFTPSSSPTRGTAAILLGLSLSASVRAQDRTTEAGEAAITGMYFSLLYNPLARTVWGTEDLCDVFRSTHNILRVWQRQDSGIVAK